MSYENNFDITKKTLFFHHLEVVDRLERVDAGHLAVLEAEQGGLEVLARIPGVLADQEEVRLKEAGSK